jgi:UDP-sugar transporter A1/2/3
MRNVQLSLLSLPFGLVTCVISDYSALREVGFFHGYDAFVVYLVLLQAGGGLLVALVVKYADNILKGFATSLAIVISCISSVYFFDFRITFLFLLGAAFVIFSIFLYGHTPTPVKNGKSPVTV